jgi:hypothetical protein
MDKSHFKKLPLELRQMVYEDCFEGDFFDISLAPLQVCSEMREEADQFLKKMNKQIVLHSDNAGWMAWAALDPQRLQALVQRINTTPPHLRPNRLVFQLQHEYNLIHSTHGVKSITGAEFSTWTRQLIAAVHPCDVELSVNFAYHRLSPCLSTFSYHADQPGEMWTVCPRDAPMKSRACEHILVKVSLLDKTRAQKVVDDAFAEKRRQFDAHRNHRMCHVKFSGVDKALESLTVAHRRMNDMFELL